MQGSAISPDRPGHFTRLAAHPRLRRVLMIVPQVSGSSTSVTHHDPSSTPAPQRHGCCGLPECESTLGLLPVRCRRVFI